MNQEQLNKVLGEHKKWLGSEAGGKKADLRRADLPRAYLRRANLYGADLRRADLYGADLCEAYLRRADLCEANLREADLCEADLRRADLRRANLRGADLCEANLYGADLYGADLRETNLCGADLSFCKGILSFTGEKHLLVYFKEGNEYYFKIGCITKTAKEWLEEFEHIGEDHNYGSSIEIYGDVIKLFSQYDLLEEDKV